MKRIRAMKKRTAILLAIAMVVLTAGAAFAFVTFHSSGTGTAPGTGTIPSATTPYTLSGTWNAAAFTTGPGSTVGTGPSTPITYTANEASANPAPLINDIDLASVSFDAGHSTCPVGSFDLGPTGHTAENFQLAVSASAQALPTAGVVRFVDLAVDQSACSGATVTLNLIASN